jgi:hypothetical protein
MDLSQVMVLLIICYRIIRIYKLHIIKKIFGYNHGDLLKKFRLGSEENMKTCFETFKTVQSLKITKFRKYTSRRKYRAYHTFRL